MLFLHRSFMGCDSVQHAEPSGASVVHQACMKVVMLCMREGRGIEGRGWAGEERSLGLDQGSFFPQLWKTGSYSARHRPGMTSPSP